MSELLVTLPVHNEAGLLSKSFHALAGALDRSGEDYRLAIAEDGSTDGTVAIVEQLREEFPSLLIQCLPERAGRGLALRRLWGAADASIYAFVDADLPAGPESVLRLVEAIRGGADVATGSRYCEGAVVHRPWVRGSVSRVYNGLVRAAFDEPIQDHQCGLKAFRRQAWEALLPRTREDSWAWDTEVLVQAHRMGLAVREVPVEWTEHRSPRTPMGRLASDVRLHGGALLRLRRTVVSERARPTGRPTANPFGETRTAPGQASAAGVR